MRRSPARGVPAWIALAWLSLACGKGDHRPPAGPTQALDTAHAAPELPVASPVPPPGREALPVNGWSGPAGQPFEVALRSSEGASGHPRRFGSITLQTALRRRSPEHYPCSSCHLDRGVVMADRRTEDAHQDIQPTHPERTGALCSTCHAAENVEQLALRTGERASLDESYRLCAQCHFGQVETWAKGGHGKRLDGWAGRRVVMGCADCHEPHRPVLQPQIPFRAPRIERTRSPTQ